MRKITAKCEWCGGLFSYERRCGNYRRWCSEKCKRDSQNVKERERYRTQTPEEREHYNAMRRARRRRHTPEQHQRVMAYQREYRRKNKELQAEYQRKWWSGLTTEEKRLHYAKKNRARRGKRKCSIEQRMVRTARRYAQLRELRKECVSIYGGACQICGEPRADYLEFHHRNNPGDVTKKETGKGAQVHKWITNNPTRRTNIMLLCVACHRRIHSDIRFLTTQLQCEGYANFDIITLGAGKCTSVSAGVWGEPEQKEEAS